MYGTHVLYDVDMYDLGEEKHNALRRYQCKVLRYGMNARIIHTYQGHTDLDQIS